MMKKITLLTALILCFGGSADGQFLKKLRKKIRTASEKTVERKAEQKASKETEKVFDATFDKKTKDKKKKGIPGLSTVEPAGNYAFIHKVEMQIKSGKDVMNADYYLPDSKDFLGVQIKDKKVKEGSFTVFDVEREAMFNYMESDGKKMKMGVDFKMDDESNEATFDIVATGNTKTILGYKCQEYKMTGEDMTATIWITKEVDIRFPSKFYSVKQNKNNNQKWMNELDGWAMEMTMIDTSKRKSKTIIMSCLSIEKSNFKINSKEYQNIGY
ncbi:MAG: DUF4412 domain-containing protein [Saprospiraceae bacterium]